MFPREGRLDTFVTEGIRQLPKSSLSIGLPPAFPRCVLIVTTTEGDVEELRISKRVAEELIATGLPYDATGLPYEG